MTGHYFQPYSEAFTADPYPVYARLRSADPVYRSEELGLTLFSRHADILALLRNRRFGRARVGDDTTIPRDMLPHYRRYVSRNLLEREGQTHSRLRAVFSKLLTPPRIAALEQSIRVACEDLVARARVAGQFDLLEDIAVPLTVESIAELMGWPAAERYKLRPWSARIVRLYEKDCSPADETAAEEATAQFAAQLDELADARRSQPADDLIGELVQFEQQGELDRDELISSCMLLLNAGHEATVNAAGNGLLALLRHPQQQAMLRADPALVPVAIEEMLRYDAPLHLFHRFAHERVEFAGRIFEPGDKIGLLYGSANRDEQAFPDADRFDARRRPNRHFAFGAGTHFCMGAPLARLELATLFRTLLAHMPALRLADPEPEHRPGLVFRGLRKLLLDT